MSKRKINKKYASILLSLIGSIVIIALIFLGANQNEINKLGEFLGIDVNNITNNIQTSTQTAVEGELNIYFIDVGQADSILIINKDEAMLMDAGNNEDGDMVVNFIKDKGITKLKYVVGTHPHEDHIGGLDNVINSLDVENVLMPKIQTNTKTFESVLDAISNKGLKIQAPNKKDTYQLSDANIEVMTDSINKENQLNLSSIVMRLTYGNTSFLFMGDAEKQNEDSINWPKTDVLKVGHHGSNTSSSDSFLNQVSPKYSIITVGKDNSYGLPKENIIKKLENINSIVYRTDEKGTIQIISNGKEIAINTEK